MQSSEKSAGTVKDVEGERIPPFNRRITEALALCTLRRRLGSSDSPDVPRFPLKLRPVAPKRLMISSRKYHILRAGAADEAYTQYDTDQCRAHGSSNAAGSTGVYPVPADG